MIPPYVSQHIVPLCVRARVLVSFSVTLLGFFTFHRKADRDWFSPCFRVLLAGWPIFVCAAWWDWWSMQRLFRGLKWNSIEKLKQHHDIFSTLSLHANAQDCSCFLSGSNFQHCNLGLVSRGVRSRNKLNSTITTAIPTAITPLHHHQGNPDHTERWTEWVGLAEITPLPEEEAARWEKVGVMSLIFFLWHQTDQIFPEQPVPILWSDTISNPCQSGAQKWPKCFPSNRIRPQQPSLSNGIPQSSCDSNAKRKKLHFNWE